LRIGTSSTDGEASSGADAGPKQRVSLLLYLWDEDQPATPLTATEMPVKPTHLDDGRFLIVEVGPGGSSSSVPVGRGPAGHTADGCKDASQADPTG
jgi:hypothetical protein